MINSKNILGFYLVVIVSLSSQLGHGRTVGKTKVQKFVRTLSLHWLICGSAPVKQPWYKRGKLRSTCAQIESERLNKDSKSFADVEINQKNIYILNFSQHLGDYVLHHAIFAEDGARVWRSYQGYKDIKHFCDRFQANVCSSFIMNKVKYCKYIFSNK